MRSRLSEALKTAMKDKDATRRSTLRLINAAVKDRDIALRGEVEELIEKKTYRLFFPHGVSHMLGLDVHDVYLEGRTKRAKDLRADFRLQEGFCITVEPGLYFVEALIRDRALRRRHGRRVNWSKAEAYLGFGGIRIDDDVVLRKRGVLNLTAAPKSVRDIESLRTG